IGIPRDRNTPRLRRAADREVPQAAIDEASSLVVAVARQHELGPRVVELEQPILVGREPEEPVLLLQPLRNGSVIRTFAVDELGLGLDRLAAVAVEPGVDVLVDVAVVVDALQELLDESLVPLIARANEEVVDRVQAPGQLPPDADDPVGVLLRLEP